MATLFSRVSWEHFKSPRPGSGLGFRYKASKMLEAVESLSRAVGPYHFQVLRLVFALKLTNLYYTSSVFT